jgi:methionyl-tRNA formyltransferase
VRVVFLGTPEEAVPTLRGLHDGGHDVALVVTQPDRRRGRGSELAPSPVKRAAGDLGLPVLAPERASDVLDDLRSSGAELGVVVAFGQLLRPAVLEALAYGFVNVHFSLLPRWRGAAPVERAILAGDAETGVCLMQIDEGLDSGPVYACERTAIAPDDTAGTLKARLAESATSLLVDRLEALPTLTPSPQVGEPTYANKLSRDEFRLDWSRPASELDRVIRAGNPRPGAWTELGGRRLRVLSALIGDAVPSAVSPGQLLPGPAVATADRLLVLREVQPEGRQPMPAAAWLRGLQPPPDTMG